MCDSIQIDAPNPPPAPPPFVPPKNDSVSRNSYAACDVTAGGFGGGFGGGFVATLRSVDAFICAIATFGLFRLALLSLLLLVVFYCAVMALSRCIHATVERGVDGLSALSDRVWQQLCYGSPTSTRKNHRPWIDYKKLKHDTDEMDDLGDNTIPSARYVLSGQCIYRVDRVGG